MCQCNSQNCGCVPKDYTSSMIYDGLKFACPELAALKPNCTSLNDLLQSLGDLVCGVLSSRKVISMGAWDIQTLGNLNRLHNLSATEFASITEISAIITNDAQTLSIPLGVASGTSSNGRMEVDSVGVTMVVTAGEVFDSASYSNAVINRGYIVINYTKD